jgi:hypothetical protein
VVDAIDYAQAEGLRVAAQRTGHSAEPLGDLADSLLIRTAALSRASIDAERRVARVGSGRRPRSSGLRPATAPRRR